MKPVFDPPVAVALDAPDVATAEQWAAEIGPHVSVLKLGLEFYLGAGAEGGEEGEEDDFSHLGTLSG